MKKHIKEREGWPYLTLNCVGMVPCHRNMHAPSQNTVCNSGSRRRVGCSLPPRTWTLDAFPPARAKKNKHDHMHGLLSLTKL